MVQKHEASINIQLQWTLFLSTCSRIVETVSLNLQEKTLKKSVYLLCNLLGPNKKRVKAEEKVRSHRIILFIVKPFSGTILL